MTYLHTEVMYLSSILDFVSDAVAAPSTAPPGHPCRSAMDADTQLISPTPWMPPPCPVRCWLPLCFCGSPAILTVPLRFVLWHAWTGPRGAHCYLRGHPHCRAILAVRHGRGGDDDRQQPRSAPNPVFHSGRPVGPSHCTLAFRATARWQRRSHDR
jgi:hypothetical protein